MRADPTLTADYAALKRVLAAKHTDNREAYTGSQERLHSKVGLASDGWDTGHLIRTCSRWVGPSPSERLGSGAARTPTLLITVPSTNARATSKSEGLCWGYVPGEARRMSSSGRRAEAPAVQRARV